jgi:hypothetical protein
MNIRRLLMLIISPTMKLDGPPKTITNAPAGYRGFYTFGITSYIKQNYDVANYSYFGASAGASNSLFLAFRGDDDIYVDQMLSRVDSLKRPTLPRILKEIKRYNMEKYTECDFDLDKLRVGVTCIKPMRKECKVYRRFDTLEEALDCTIVSSNIPLVSGSPFDTYLGVVSYDGAFCNYPLVGPDDFHIEPWMWCESKEYKIFNIRIPRFWARIYEGMFVSRKWKASQLYQMGWDDAYAHREQLDAYFLP